MLISFNRSKVLKIVFKEGLRLLINIAKCLSYSITNFLIRKVVRDSKIKSL